MIQISPYQVLPRKKAPINREMQHANGNQATTYANDMVQIYAPPGTRIKPSWEAPLV